MVESIIAESVAYYACLLHLSCLILYALILPLTGSGVNSIALGANCRFDI